MSDKFFLKAKLIHKSGAFIAEEGFAPGEK